jgi:PEP-CTERM motif
MKTLMMCCVAALILFAGFETSSAATVICGPAGCPGVFSPTYPGTPLPVRFPPPPPLGPGIVDLFETGVESVNERGCIIIGGNACRSNLGVPVVEGDVVLVEKGAFGNPSDFENNPHEWSDVLRFTNTGRVGTVTLLSDIGREPDFNEVPLSPSDLSSNVVFLEEVSDPTIYQAVFTILAIPEPELFGANYFIHSSLDAPVPEPSTWAMMLIGFAGLCIAGYRASRKSSSVAT